MTTATRRLGLSKQTQLDFSSGSFPGLEVIPPNGAEDIVNGIVAEDGSLLHRGGTSYYGTLSATDALPFRNAWSGNLGAAGPVSLVSRSQGSPVVEGFWAITGSLTDFVSAFTDDTARQRPAAADGLLAFVSNTPPAGTTGIRIVGWGGGTSGGITGQTVNLTDASKTVTGVGTAFVTNGVAPGHLMHQPGATGVRIGVVESVQSETVLTLVRPWVGTTTTSVDFVVSVAVDTAIKVLPVTTTAFPVFISSIFDRFVYAKGSRITFTPAQDPLAVGSFDDYHELPFGAYVTGLEPLRDQMLVFTTQGVFTISGMAYDLTDALGNVQQRLERAAPDVILWDNLGVAGWKGAVVAPCTDDVYLIESAGSMRPVAGGMRRLYRSYVQAGYQPRQAQVFQGRYFLPVFNGTTWVDTLVCDLRTGAWVRWDGIGASLGGLTQVVGVSTRRPKLVGLGAVGSSRRVHDLTATLDESGPVSDADGSGYDLKVTTRTFSAPGFISQMWRRFRARFETSGTLTATLEYATGKPGSSFASVSSPQTISTDNEQVWSWRPSKRARAIRFRLTISSDGLKTLLRGFEVFSRPGGRS